MVLYVNVILYWWEEDGSYNGEYTQPSLYLTVHSCHTGICWLCGSCLPVWAQVRQPFLHFMYKIISKSLYRVFCCKKLNQSILRICLSWQCTSIHLGNTLLLTTQIYLSATYISYTVKLRCIGHSDVKDNFPCLFTKNRWVFRLWEKSDFGDKIVWSVSVLYIRGLLHSPPSIHLDCFLFFKGVMTESWIEAWNTTGYDSSPPRYCKLSVDASAEQ